MIKCIPQTSGLILDGLEFILKENLIAAQSARFRSSDVHQRLRVSVLALVDKKGWIQFPVVLVETRVNTG